MIGAGEAKIGAGEAKIGAGEAKIGAGEAKIGAGVQAWSGFVIVRMGRPSLRIIVIPA